jgi:magnesium and cobalt transporter
MSSNHSDGEPEQKSWLERLGQVFQDEPQNIEELVILLREAQKRQLIGSDALSMIEGVLQVSELRVRDIMIPRSQMVVISRDAVLEEIFPVVIEAAHSRYPVIDEDRTEVVGILLAKDLLPYNRQCKESRFDVRDVLRPAVFVPESKRLNVLLNEFRSNRNHMAVVVDEYGDAAGLVTIEDVLEQIVGEIEDEHDIEEAESIYQRSESEFTVKASTEVDDFNDYFSSNFSEDEVDTIGGLIARELGHVAEQGEEIRMGRFCFEVIRSDTRRIHLLKLTTEASESDSEPEKER